MTNYFYLIPILPLIGFLINGLLGKRINSEKFSGILASLLVFIPFVLTIISLVEMMGLEPESRKIGITYFSWILTGNIGINYAFIVDHLSLVMLLIILGVGFLIHVYSIGYMHNDKEYSKYFAYMNLFIFAMLNLVLADNFLLLFLVVGCQTKSLVYDRELCETAKQIIVIQSRCEDAEGRLYGFVLCNL